MQLEAQLADRQVTIELTDAARGWLAGRGYDKQFGARPLARVIQEHIKKPLAEELLFGRLAKGGIVQVDIEDGLPVFTYPEGSVPPKGRSEEHTSELQSLMRISYAVSGWKKKIRQHIAYTHHQLY